MQDQGDGAIGLAFMLDDLRPVPAKVKLASQENAKMRKDCG